MQYILTQEEYDDLKKAGRNQRSINVDVLQTLCTQVAKHKPVTTVWGTNEPVPWGCVLVNDEDNPEYCDGCPVAQFCPNTSKNWSK